jgi:hypothetical protein
MKHLLPYLADDQKAADYLRQLRWPDGVTCPRCGSDAVESRERGDNGLRRFNCAHCAARVAYPLAADNVLRPLPFPLLGGNQPVMRTRNRFSRPCPALLACNGTHLGRATLRCSTPAGS